MTPTPPRNDLIPEAHVPQTAAVALALEVIGAFPAIPYWIRDKSPTRIAIWHVECAGRTQPGKGTSASTLLTAAAIVARHFEEAKR